MASIGDAREVEGHQNSLDFENLARFVVDEHNKKQNAQLEFEVNVKSQVVFGTVCHITLETKDGSKKNVYEAKVWEKPLLNFKKLQEFKLIE